MKVIALEDGLEDLGEYLCYRDCKIVPLNYNAERIDAVVYMESKLEEIVGIPTVRMANLVSDEMYPTSQIGVLIVNVKNKTHEEVYQIIKDRLYEHFI